jgi:hypothetical protein
MKLPVAGIIQFTCLLACAGGLYGLKTIADGKGDEMASLERQIRQDRAAIHKLEADIAFLSQSGRIEAAAAGIGLAPVAPGQIATLAELDQIAPLPANPAGAAPVTGAR